MDTTTIIAVLFVVTILTSLGGKPYHQPQGTTASTTEQYTQAQIATAELPSTVGFPAEEGFSAKKPIYNLVCKYRSSDQAEEIANSIMKYSQLYDVNPKLVAALMVRESRFNPRALSSSGAAGLGQLLPSTCKTVSVTDPYDIDQNAMGTTRYLKYLLDKFAGSPQQVPFALAGYLEGPNLVERQQGYSQHAAGYIQAILNTYHQL
jgi:soluble lytic murein transglycosylase-like protein